MSNVNKKKLLSKNNFVKNDIAKGALILIIAGILGKILGAIYRIPLSNILGAEGIGIYQMIFPVFSLALIISSSGVSANMAQSIARCRAEKIGCIKKIFISGFIYSLIVGLIFAVIMFVLAKDISLLQGNQLATQGYKIMALALIFASLLAPFRGFFQGYQNMVPTATSQILEQLFKVALGLTLAFILTKQSLEMGVVGAFLGIAFAEFFAMVYLIIKFFIFKHSSKTNFLFNENKNKLKLKDKKDKIDYYNQEDLSNKKFLIYNKNINHIINNKKLNINLTTEKTSGDINKNLLNKNKQSSINNKSFFLHNITFTLSFLIIPLITAFDSFVVINLLNKNFVDSFSTALYGLQSGIVNSLINFPVIISVAISLSLLPSLTYLLTKNKIEEASLKIKKIFSMLWIVIIPCVISFVILAPLIMNLLYADIEPYLLTISSQLLQISSIQILFISLLQICIAVFQSMGKENVPIGIMSIGALFKVGLTVLLVSSSKFTIFGLAISNLIFYAFSSIFCLILIKKVFNFTLSFKLLCVSAGSSLILASSFYILNVLSIGIWAKISLIVIFGGCFYIIPLFLFGILNFEEIKTMFKLKKQDNKKLNGVKNE